MPLGPLLVAFGLTVVAELPDKTMIATVIMGTRYRALLVWAGATAAFAVHVALAVAVGSALSHLPHRLVVGLTTVLFAGGAAYLLLTDEKEAEEKGAEEVAEAPSGLRAAATAFVVIFVAEFGDLTQVLIVNLSAKYHAPIAIFVGALLGLASVALLGALGGSALLRVVPLRMVRKGGGLVLAGLAAWSLVQWIAG